MKPFLRPVDAAPSTPEGWVSEPAGVWAGREVEVLYDPECHDVAFFRSGISDHLRERCSEIGFEQIDADGPNEMWVRDRRSALQAAWNRVEQSASRGTTAHDGLAL